MTSFLFVLLQGISILIFGHSFGVDSTELLPAIAVESGVNDLTVGRFIKGNCSLEEHWNFLQADSLKYSVCLPSKTRFSRVKLTYREAIASRKWDYVIFQTSLENEGRYETSQPWLNNLVSCVRKIQQEKFGVQPTICWNMFWPISRLHENGKHERSKYRLSFYGNSSQKSWEAYVSATKEMSKDTGINFIIPTGTAVMNFRASSLNTPDVKELTRDGYHMNYGAGRYLAACTMYERILKPIYRKNIALPKSGEIFPGTEKYALPVDRKVGKALVGFAKQAVAHPYEVTARSRRR